MSARALVQGLSHSHPDEAHIMYVPALETINYLRLFLLFTDTEQTGQCLQVYHISFFPKVCCPVGAQHNGMQKEGPGNFNLC